MKMAVLLGSVLLLGGTWVACGQGTRSTTDGVFTEEQAKKGEATYQSRCASCHGADLHSTDPEATELTDGSFKYSWQGKTIAEKFTVIRDTMPPRRGGSLDEQTYLDVVTYILRFNGVRAGAQKLEPDIETLKRIVIAIP